MRMLKPRPIGATRPATPIEEPEVAPVAAPATPARRTRALALVPAPVEKPGRAATADAAARPVAFLQHAHSFAGLLAQSMARSAVNTAAIALVPAVSPRADTVAEMLELQGAVMERMLQLQQDWWAGWNAWLGEFSQLRRADTLSEHFEQQYNIAAQFGELLKTQASDLADLQDTLQVDSGYWVARKLQTTG